MKIEIEESALDSLKAMAQQLQDEHQILLNGMHDILYAHANDVHRPKAFNIARDCIAACTETKQVLA